MKDLTYITDYLNEHFDQNSDEYSIVTGAKPQILRLDDETAVSLWACGAIVCIGRGVYFIQEDDGNWFTPKYVEVEDAKRDLDFWKHHSHVGMQSSFSLGWADEFIRAFQRLNDYVKKNGEPYYYVGTNNICGYELKKKDNSR